MKYPSLHSQVDPLSVVFASAQELQLLLRFPEQVAQSLWQAEAVHTTSEAEPEFEYPALHWHLVPASIALASTQLVQELLSELVQFPQSLWHSI